MLFWVQGEYADPYIHGSIPEYLFPVQGTEKQNLQFSHMTLSLPQSDIHSVLKINYVGIVVLLLCVLKQRKRKFILCLISLWSENIFLYTGK